MMAKFYQSKPVIDRDPWSSEKHNMRLLTNKVTHISKNQTRKALSVPGSQGEEPDQCKSWMVVIQDDSHIEGMRLPERDGYNHVKTAPDLTGSFLSGNNRVRLLRVLNKLWLRMRCCSSCP